MIGTGRWNVIFGLIGGLITFASSLSSNGFAISTYRFIIAFAIFFLLMFFVRFILNGIVHKFPQDPPEEITSPPVSDEGKGEFVDYSTPDETIELSDLLRKQLEQEVSKHSNKNTNEIQFEPLKPEKINSSGPLTPEQLALVLRQMTGE